MLNTKIIGAVQGSLIGDAAAMGLHWIYDTKRIKEVAGDFPEFLPPDPKHYQGVMGVFAHKDRPIGSLTRYGATVELTARHLAHNKGAFIPSIASDEFLDTFGYGGTFTGYIDHPAEGSLDNIRHRNKEIEKTLQSLAGKMPFPWLIQIQPVIKRVASRPSLEGWEEALADSLKALTDISLSQEQISLLGEKIQDVHNLYGGETGVSDFQLPLLAQIIPVALLLASQEREDPLFTEEIHRAAQLTHVDKSALKVADFTGYLLGDLLREKPLREAIEGKFPLLPENLVSKVKLALSQPWEGIEKGAEQFGMSCVLNQGLPLALHTLLHSSSYSEAVRRTILAGGDSCGRGILVGALAGLLWDVGTPQGIPQEWIRKVPAAGAIRKALESIV